jgi:hypothetical protein
VPRPTSVTILALVVLCIAVYNALGAAAAIQGYTVLLELPLSVPPAYLVARGTFWAVVFALAAWGLWRLRHWGRLGAPLALTLYLALGWVERLALAQSDYARLSAPCFLALHLGALAAVWWLLLRPAARQVFSDR